MTVERCEIMVLLAGCVCVNIAFGAWRHLVVYTLVLTADRRFVRQDVFVGYSCV
jgi:hypothetical protein